MRGFVQFLVVLFCCVTWQSKAQLSDFDLTLSKADETCKGNGSITISVSKATANAQFLYKVFKLPNTKNAVSIQTTNYLSGLTAGNYRVVAIQSLNNLSNTKEKDVTIANQITGFAFNVSAEMANCAKGASLVVTATTGTLASCEILPGSAEERPLQSSNVFTNLQSGTYNIRAYNECGVAKVKSYTLNVVKASLKISELSYVENTAASCDSITVSNTITSSAGSINYPLTVRHTLNFMELGGNDIIIDRVIETGDSKSIDVTAVMPRLATEKYVYEISVIDNCNELYSKPDNIVDPNIDLSATPGEAVCAEKYIILNPSKFKGSYTVTFLNAPKEFDPSKFNATPAGPFSTGTVNFGGPLDPVPFGNYEILIKDSCGRTATASVLLEFKKPVPSVGAVNNGCFSLFGSMTISNLPQKLVFAEITAAPASYTEGAIPQDITSKINKNGTIKLSDLPLGKYTVHFIDDCGFEYTVTKEVPPYKPRGFNIAALPSCTAGFGGVRFRSGNGHIDTAYITAAPKSFAHSLPYDLSAHKATDGFIYITDLPEGTYTFEGTDVCGVNSTPTEIVVEGYNAPKAPFEFTPRCGTFSVKMSDDSNGKEGAQYFLQKFNPLTGSWGHPQTNAAYAEGTTPVAANGLALSNNATRSNLNYSGKFRIVKKFETFSNASTANTVCISVLGEFEYNEQLSITATYSMACAGTPGDVVVAYLGTPTKFRIIKKNGANFVIDNGADNVFKNLEPAEYVIELRDACGNILTQWFNLIELPALSDAQQPLDIVECAQPGTAGATASFYLRGKDADVLGPLYSSMYTVSYHFTDIDAEAGVNALPDYYTNVENGQTIYVRLQHNEIDICHKTTSFKLFVGEAQSAEITTKGLICDTGSVTLTATPGFDSYVWSNGATTQSITVTEPGVYNVEARRHYGTTYCPAPASTEIIQSYTPKVREIETADWTNDHNSVTVYTERQADHEFSLDGFTYQDSNTFHDLEAGVYTVYVKDKNGCGVISQEVVLLNYPKFFTPNGDGHNDKWRIKHSFKEPDFYVTIFDRYGKLITTLKSNSDGWDGTLNGIQLPSTDYWFVVTREDGRELRGHFAMLR